MYIYCMVIQLLRFYILESNRTIVGMRYTKVNALIIIVMQCKYRIIIYMALN